jgi:hypothetical protein
VNLTGRMVHIFLNDSVSTVQVIDLKMRLKNDYA